MTFETLNLSGYEEADFPDAKDIEVYKGILVNVLDQEISVFGNTVKLNKKETKLISYLMAHAEQVLSREEIVGKMGSSERAQLAKDGISRYGSLRVHVYRLNSKLRKLGVNSVRIVNLPTRGYVIRMAPKI